MKLTYIEAVRGYNALKSLEDKEGLGDSLVWPIVVNLDELETVKSRYDKAYAQYVQNQVVRDDDGNPEYPEGVDPEDGNVDPKFKDKQKLIQQLNDLAQKEVDVDIETVSRSDFDKPPKPRLLRQIRFMIEDL